MEYHKIDNWRKLPELSRLKDLSTPPKAIFYQGKWSSKIFDSCVSVVGSRRMTDYGRRVLEKIIPQLVMSKKTIVSGFMYGVDQYAHQLALENGGKTIAVLGWGISHKLIGTDSKLGRKITDNGGLLISEWENQEPTHWTFPSRNRIVAALSSEIYIIEAAVKSGSLITARLGRKLKRKIWAVPGPVTSRTSAGTNSLIANGHAYMWVDDYIQSAPVKKRGPLLSLLENEALTTDEIARSLNVPVAQIGAELSLLTISGQLVERGGKYYINDVS